MIAIDAILSLLAKRMRVKLKSGVGSIDAESADRSCRSIHRSSMLLVLLARLEDDGDGNINPRPVGLIISRWPDELIPSKK